LQDRELLGRIGRSPLSAVLAILAPFLAEQEIGLPDASLPDILYFAALAATFRSQPIKVLAYLPPFLAARSLAQAKKPLAGGITPPGPLAQCCYALRKGQGAWGLTYAGEQAVFADRAGMDFVEYLLKHPGEVIHSLALLARVQGEAPVQQRSAVLDERDTTRDYLRQMSRLRKVMESEDASGREKEVAEEELAQFESALPDIHHRTMDEAAKTAKTVRQAIRRVCSSLGQARDQQHRPDPVLTAFAAHLQKQLLGPSQPGSAPAGHLVYEPPAGVIWA
jgi:hypothetical protein